MLTLAVDNNFDLYINAAGAVATLRDKEAIAQCCMTATSARRGEMVMDMDSGIPYISTVYGDGNVMAFEAALRRTLADVPGVTQVITVDVQKAETLTYSASIMTTFGPTDI